MARRPDIKGDRDDWGAVLNEYLSVSLAEDGTIKDTAAAALPISDATRAALASQAGGIPGEMASPPDLTMGTASTITNGVAYRSTGDVGGTIVPINTDRWRLTGPYQPEGQTGWPSEAIGCKPVRDYLGLSSRVSARFWHEGSELEINIRNFGQRMRLTIDGEYVSETPTVAAADNTVGYWHVAFGSVALRHIVLEFNRGFRGVVIGPDDTLYADPGDGRRLVCFGDSYTSGQSNEGAHPLNNWPVTAGLLLGIDDVIATGIGGTGYLTDNGYQTFGERVHDITRFAPTDVIVLGGINDSGQSYPDLYAAALAFYQDIVVGAPGAAVYVVGPAYPNGQPPGSIIWMRDAFAAAAAVAGVHHIDPIGGPAWSGDATDSENTGWITGKGVSGAPSTADPGNSNRYTGGATGADTIHPTPAGHVYYGRRIAQAVLALAAP